MVLWARMLMYNKLYRQQHATLQTKEDLQWSITLWEAQTFPKTERTVCVLVEPQSMQLSLVAAHAECFSVLVCLKLTNMHTVWQRSSQLIFKARQKSNKDLKKEKFNTERVTLVPETTTPLVCSYSLITYEMSCDKRHCLSKLTMAGAGSNSKRGISCITNLETPSGSEHWVHTLKWTKCRTPFFVWPSHTHRHTPVNKLNNFN